MREAYRNRSTIGILALIQEQGLRCGKCRLSRNGSDVGDGRCAQGSWPDYSREDLVEGRNLPSTQDSSDVGVLSLLGFFTQLA